MSTDGSAAHSLRDPLAEARAALFPPLRTPLLAQAAEGIGRNDLDSAEALLSKHLRRHPDDPDALNLLADIARRNGRFEDAEERAARCGPAPGYRFNHAVLLLHLGRHEQALEILNDLLLEDARNPLYRHQKGRVLRAMNLLDEALACRRALVRDYPDCAEFWLSYGDALRAVGEQEEVIPAYRKALELAPSRAAVYLRLCDLKTYRFSGAEIATMEALLKDAGFPAEDRAILHFALGKALGDEGKYADAYANYAKGNALRRLGTDADPERLTAHRRDCEALFTPAFFAERRDWGSPTRAPIFIVGMPRSASTLVEQILSSHSAIEGLGELPDMDKVAKLLKPDLHAVTRLDAKNARALGEEYLALTKARRKQDCPLFTDKALSNFNHVGLIHLILPHAKIVDVRRHPLDCGWSCFVNHFPGGMPFSHRLGDIGRHYADYVRLMAHFERVLPNRIHRVIYEQLVADPEGEIRRLLQYLELPFEETCLRFHESKRGVTTLSSEQVRRPLHQGGIGQWGPYEQWLGSLKSALGPVLNHYPDVPPEFA